MAGREAAASIHCIYEESRPAFHPRYREAIEIIRWKPFNTAVRQNHQKECELTRGHEH